MVPMYAKNQEVLLIITYHLSVVYTPQSHVLTMEQNPKLGGMHLQDIA